LRDWINKIHCIDALEGLESITDSSIDLIFADPPFNVGKDYGLTNDRRQDYYEWCEQWIDLCFKKLKDNGTIYLMTIPRHLQKLFPMLGSRGVFINLVAWRNVSAAHSKRGFWNSYQPILIYAKGEGYLFNTYAQIKKNKWRWSEYDKGPRGQLHDYWDDISFIFAGSVHHKEAIIVPGTNKKAHPTQMPIALGSRAILFSTNKNDLVLDPFMGIGAVIIAARDLQRNYIGFDINPEYIKIANKRLAQGVLF